MKACLYRFSPKILGKVITKQKAEPDWKIMKKIITVKTSKDIFIQSLSSNNVPKVILARDTDGLHDAELSILKEAFFLSMKVLLN